MVQSTYNSFFIDNQSSCYCIDLFANGNDYSSATIEQGRNLYYQQQLSQQIEREMTELKSELTDGINLHLNLNQSFLINDSALIVSFKKLPIESFLNQTIADGFVHIPSTMNTSNQSQLLRVCSFFFLFFKEIFPLVHNGTIIIIWK